jgi:hypothetical protein
LSEASWAHRISKHSATKVTPFELVYRQEVILPIEVNLDALRIAQQNELLAVDYHNSKPKAKVATTGGPGFGNWNVWFLQIRWSPSMV